MEWSNNPVADAIRYAAEKERETDIYPCCVECGEIITDDELYDIGGDLFCVECIYNNHRKSTENYIIR